MTTEARPERSRVPVDGFVVANGLRIRYLDWAGEGPVTLLLHHQRGVADVWRRFVDVTALPQRFVAPDERGSGETDKPPSGYSKWDRAADAAALIDALGLGRVRVVGSGAGSAVGIALAAKHPDKVSALAMLDSGFPVDPSLVANVVADIERTPQDFPTREAAIAYVRARKSGGYSWSPVWREYFDWTFRRREDGRWAFKYDKHAMTEASAHLADDLWPDVDRLRCPVLVMVGGRDAVLKANDAAEIARRANNGRLVVFDDCHHFMLLEGDLRPFELEVRRFFESRP